MGACVSTMLNACKEIFLPAISSTQLVPDSEGTDPSAMTSTVVAASGEMVPSAMSSITSTQQSTTGSVASTSSSNENASRCGKYEVFINHRGIETKDSLASTIYHTLDLRGVRAFFDREELEAGKVFSHDIEEAIRSAFIHIAIFSPKYAESPWCLHELTLMLQTGKKIIPVFYRVDISHVRHILGDYSKAFSSHKKKKRYPLQQIEEWKTALSKASYITGYEVNNKRKNDEGLLVKNIVNDVIKEKTEKMKNPPLLHVAAHPVGLDKAIEEFQNFVDQSGQSTQNVNIVGIAGLGGCGKTTLAKEYFNKKRSSYTVSCFLFDVRDAKNRLHELQQQLLDNLEQPGEDLLHIKTTIHHKSQGKGILEHHLRSVKALIVLDDVDHMDQIDALLPGTLQADSLIIVTTRDLGVIASSASLSLSVSVYKKNSLDPVHAKHLFCWHAFLRDSPANGFEDLVNQFVTACQGLPLSLKVLGAQLCGNRSRCHWESLLHKISQILPDDIKQILKVSYDALDEQQQQMFLDVACFFIGEPKDITISIWDGSSSDGVLWSGWHGFQILENKCLVEVDHENRIRMHDHLRDLGRGIAIKETPSRFWSHSQFVNSQRPLKERLPLRGIIAATGSSFGYHWRHYCKLHYEPPFEECMQLLGHSTSPSRRLMPSAFGLQLLVVRGNYFKEEFAGLSEELVWLRWYDFCHEKLPPWLSTGKLRVLELYQSDRLEERRRRDVSMFELWGPNDPPPLQLRELIIELHSSWNFQMIPETIGSLKHLKKIVVTDCFSTGISSLPEGFSLLESLEHLELRHFGDLSSLPTNFGKLRELKYIDLFSASSLAALPVSFNQLTKLQYLYLAFCTKLQLEKDILENITKLEIVRLGHCSELQQLPSGITRQRYLRELDLSYTGLTELPADIGRLARLEVLKIGAGWSLPAPDCCPEGVDGVKYLPEGFGQLVNLQNLNIDICPIRELPLANPEERYSKKPTNHVDSSMFKFPRLKLIHLRRTKVSTISISEDCCPCLEDLYLSGNHDLMEIKALPTTLKRVDILHCPKLESIRGFAGLVKLQGLEIKRCPGLFELPSFADLVELQRLKIYDCPQLHKLPSFAGLVELRDFSIAKCPQLDELPSFACCTCLQELSVQVSHRITQIEGLEELRSLETLSLETSWKVPALKGLKNLDKLTTLLIRAESRSAIETCVPPNIVKRACKMGIVGRAVEDVVSVVSSLSFPNFTVVNNLQFGSEEQQMVGRVSNASCVIVCFVISCRSQKKGSIRCHQYGDKIGCYVSLYDDPDWWGRIIFPLEGKQVYIGVYPKCFHLNKDVMKGSDSVFLTISNFAKEDVEIEKAIAVIMRNGEEEKASEALHKFLELVER